MCLWQSVDVEANLAITRYLDIQIQPILPGGATCIAKLPGINLTPDGRIELASLSTRVISVESTKGVPRALYTVMHHDSYGGDNNFLNFHSDHEMCELALSLCQSTTDADPTTNTINIVTPPHCYRKLNGYYWKAPVFSMNPLRDEMTTFS